MWRYGHADHCSEYLETKALMGIVWFRLTKLALFFCRQYHVLTLFTGQVDSSPSTLLMFPHERESHMIWFHKEIHRFMRHIKARKVLWLFSRGMAPLFLGFNCQKVQTEPIGGHGNRVTGNVIGGPQRWQITWPHASYRCRSPEHKSSEAALAFTTTRPDHHCKEL